MLYMAAQTFESVKEIVKCVHHEVKATEVFFALVLFVSKFGNKKFRVLNFWIQRLYTCEEATPPPQSFFLLFTHSNSFVPLRLILSH